MNVELPPWEKYSDSVVHPGADPRHGRDIVGRERDLAVDGGKRVTFEFAHEHAAVDLLGASAEEEVLEALEPEDRDDFVLPTLEQIRPLLHRLTAKQRFVIELRYGLKDGEPHTVQEIGEWMGISHVAVVKIEQRAIAALQRAA